MQQLTDLFQMTFLMLTQRYKQSFFDVKQMSWGQPSSLYFNASVYFKKKICLMF